MRNISSVSLAVATWVPITGGALSAFWAIRNRKFVTFLVAAISLVPFILGAFGIPLASTSSPIYFLLPQIVFVALAIPAAFGFSTRGVPYFDAMILAQGGVLSAALLTKIPSLILLFFASLIVTALWGLVQSIISAVQKNFDAAAHCLAYSALMIATFLVILPYGFMGM